MLISYKDLRAGEENAPLAQVNSSDTIVPSSDMKGVQNVFKITILGTDSNYYDEQVYVMRYYKPIMITLLRDFNKKMVDMEFRQVGESIEIVCRSSNLNAVVMLSTENSDASPYAPLYQAHAGTPMVIRHNSPKFDIENSITNINDRLVNVSGRVELSEHATNTILAADLPTSGIAVPTLVRGSATGEFYKAYLNGRGDKSTCNLVLAEDVPETEPAVTYNITFAVNR